jgi:predicted PurR-regulated permease PerM
MSLSSQIISLSSKAVLVLIFTAFMLAEQRGFARKLAAAFPSPVATRISRVIGGITQQVSRYLLLQFLISAATGLCVWIALWAIGVEFALTWGVLAFVLNFIPTIGSIVASIPPVVIALAQYAPDSYWPAVATLIALLAIQMTIGNVISPRLMGDHLNLSPVAVLVSLLFWAWLWGPGGALLSVPVTAAVKIVCDNIQPLSPIGVLLGAGPRRRATHGATSPAKANQSA